MSTTNAINDTGIKYLYDTIDSEKQDKETGKGLSTNDYTTNEKNKLAGIATGATKTEASTTNGNVKINGTETQVYDDSDIQDKIDVSLESVSGNPLSISGLKSSQLAVNPVITYNPIQDLHGQSKPYPAGGGKNLYSGTNVTISSALYSAVNLDKPIPAGTYTVSAKLSSELTTGAGVSFRKADNSAINRVDISYVAGGRGYGTITISEDAYKLYFYYSTTTSGTGTRTWSDIQIEEGSSATSYAPYENICPISGYDKIEVLSCGKNLFDEVIETGKLDDSTGQNTPASDRYRCKNYIPVVPNTAYTFGKNGTAQEINVFFYDTDKTFISYDGYESGFTTPNNAYYIRFYAGTVINVSTGLQLEEGSSATTYVPYHKTTDISESLGQTVYWGTYEPRTGKFTVTHKGVDMGNLTWTHNGNNNFYTTSLANEIKKPSGTTVVIDDLCSILENVSYSDYASTSSGYTSVYTNGNVHANMSGYTTASAFTTAVTGQTLVYELATPFTIQLTPHEIALSQDYAYISTNGTLITLDYHNGEMASLADVEQLNETVERGRFHRYSTDEQIVGSWIDGKTLYELTVSFGSMEAGTYKDVDMTNYSISKVVYINGSLKTAYSDQIPIPYANKVATDRQAFVRYQSSQKTLRVFVPDTEGTCTNIYITIRYTKT